MMALSWSLATVWAWLKAYWYIPIVTIIFVVIFIAFKLRKQKVDFGPIQEILSHANESYQRDIKQIQTIKDEQIAENERALRRMEHARQQVEEEFQRKEQSIDKELDRRIKRTIKKFKDDPSALAKELENETGVRVILVE
jgi:F0F1-type ATP synthase membrane subunit b/b'